MLSKIKLSHIFIGETFVEPQCIKSFACIPSLIEISLKGLHLAAIPKIFDSMESLNELKLSTPAITKAATRSAKSRTLKTCTP